MRHVAELPSRVLAEDVNDLVQKLARVRVELGEVNVLGDRDRTRTILLVTMVRVRNNRAMRPCFEALLEQGFAAQGEVIPLSVVQKFLKLQIGNHVAGILVLRNEEVISNVVAAKHRPTPALTSGYLVWKYDQCRWVCQVYKSAVDPNPSIPLDQANEMVGVAMHATVEECAKICDDEAEKATGDAYSIAANHCAKVIRKLMIAAPKVRSRSTLSSAASLATRTQVLSPSDAALLKAQKMKPIECTYGCPPNTVCDFCQVKGTP